MHEFSLAQNLTRQLMDLAVAHQARKVLRAHLAIGTEAGVVLDSFRFGFEVLSAEQPLLSGCGLHIEQPLPRAHCPRCGTLEESCNIDRCPRCGGSDLFSCGGNEIVLWRVELDLPDSPTPSEQHV